MRDFISVSQTMTTSPEVDENKDSDKEGDDGHSVPKEEDEDLPFLDSSSQHVKGMVQTVGVVCICSPATIGQAGFADVVCKRVY